jgi:RNA polymerase sigma factor (sigma-70 family)
LTVPANTNVRNAPQTSDRPPAFDARVAAYLPGLHAQAAYYCRQTADREDLVNDTVEHALKTWRDFRPDGGFWWWLKTRMRQVVSRRKKLAAAACRKPVRLPIATEPARQEDYAAIGQILDSMPERTRAIMLHTAMGEEGPEVGARFGIGRERVRQIVLATREELRAA